MVRPSVRPSVGWSVTRNFVEKQHKSIFLPIQILYRRLTEFTSYIVNALSEGQSVRLSICPSQFCEIRCKLDHIDKSKIEKAFNHYAVIHQTCGRIVSLMGLVIHCPGAAFLPSAICYGIGTIITGPLATYVERWLISLLGTFIVATKRVYTMIFSQIQPFGTK